MWPLAIKKDISVVSIMPFSKVLQSAILYWMSLIHLLQWCNDIVVSLEWWRTFKCQNVHFVPKTQTCRNWNYWRKGKGLVTYVQYLGCYWIDSLTFETANHKGKGTSGFLVLMPYDLWKCNHQSDCSICLWCELCMSMNSLSTPLSYWC